MSHYQPPWYLKNGLFMTLVTDIWYSNTWRKYGENVAWLNHLPKIPWQENIFIGADGVKLWGLWSCPKQAKGTIIINTGLTGLVQNAWYAHILARKAYSQGLAVLIYDWRGHGRTAELSPIPSSYGWREGADQLQIAEQLVGMGCPSKIVLVGFSLGGQLALWGMKVAEEENNSLISGVATISCLVESAHTLRYLRQTLVGRLIEKHFVKNFQEELRKREKIFPHTVKPGLAEEIQFIDDFDREIVINYYGFSSVEEFYKKTSAFYFLEKLSRSYLMIMAEDDPILCPKLMRQLQQQISDKPNANLIITKFGGHIAYIQSKTLWEDQFWGINRVLDFTKAILRK